MLNTIAFSQGNYMAKVNWRNYMRYWCGYTAHEVDSNLFIDRPEVQTMPSYPAEGSIKVIDDVIVVKF